MRFILISAALLAGAFATPTLAKPVPEEAAEKASGESRLKPSDFDMSQLMGMFDKLFPAQPDPAPQRLALARATAAGVLPVGTYASMFDEFAGGMVDHFLSLREADFVTKDTKKKPVSGLTLRQELAKDDPHFEERLKIIRRVIGEELVKISALMEPKMREGLARSIARRFDEKQLTEINAFMATDSGRAFAGQTMRLWIDPDVMRSMVQAFPQMITAMPGAVMRLEAETAHLPKPEKTMKKGKD
ncbi:DUF2059 domain-containing protein [Sphingomonas lutea]|uniref:DUF2059 domain-containing protein n=1 Tax=Sphingomonas lutea TaxID=1045317 RepID=A0A7G9SJZ9_9SPHN|nr:DUF2059 domain-containing protein [Sphingomonas lutea]QNN68174.1 DUF2059 domain-containing protein [Sphingomonas lutea]